MSGKTRVFVYEDKEFEDPGAEFSNEQVRDMLAGTFGALREGKIEVKEEEGRIVVEFKPRPKRKGALAAPIGGFNQWQLRLPNLELDGVLSITGQFMAPWIRAGDSVLVEGKGGNGRFRVNVNDDGVLEMSREEEA